MNSFKKYFWDVIKNHYVDIKGVATRKQYWMFVLYFWLPLYLGMILFLILPILNIYDLSFSGILTFFGIVCVIFIIGTILPSISISVRRLHDIGLSGWFLLLNLIPYLGSLIIFVFHLLPSKLEDNKYYGTLKNKVSLNDIDLLDKLHSLKGKGIITEEEFNKKKEELLK